MKASLDEIEIAMAIMFRRYRVMVTQLRLVHKVLRLHGCGDRKDCGLCQLQEKLAKIK